MKTDTRDRIISYIRTNKQAKAFDLARYLKISSVAVHKQLKRLVEEGELRRVGRPPLVLYLPAWKKKTPSIIQPAISSKTQEVIEKTYLYISPKGELLYGMTGFIQWVLSTKQEKQIEKLAEEYVRVRKETDSYIAFDGLIDATESKLRTTFPDKAIDKLFYGDFYSLPKFGKTKLGQLVLYAKQAQNRNLMEQITKQVKPLIERLIQVYNIDTFAFIPPSVPRSIQFINEFANMLQISLKRIPLLKTRSGEVIVAQKTLARLEERIINARETIFVNVDSAPFTSKNVLLIDDAVGSGSTFEETAKKIKELNLASGSIIAFAIVGSIKGFEVIREV